MSYPKTTSRYPYPKVGCAHHEGPQEAYMVCVHVMGREAPLQFLEEPTELEIGTAVCGRCEAEWQENSRIKLDAVLLICKPCFDEFRRKGVH